MITEAEAPITGLENQLGLTKREYFAAMAMQGLISNAPNGNLGNYTEGCELATKWADTLIIELNKPTVLPNGIPDANTTHKPF